MGEIVARPLDALALGGHEIQLQAAEFDPLEEQVELALFSLDEPVFPVADEFVDLDPLAIRDFRFIAVDHRELHPLLGIKGLAVDEFSGEEKFLRRRHDAIAPIRGDPQDEIVFGNRQLELIAPNIASKEARFLVVAQFDVLTGHGLLVDGLDPGDLRSPRIAIPVFLDQSLHIGDRGPLHIVQLLFDDPDLLLDLVDIPAILLDIVGGNPANPKLEQPLDVVILHRPHEELFVFRHTLGDFVSDGFLGRRLLDALVDTLLDEDLLQGQPMLLVDPLGTIVFQLSLELILQTIGQGVDDLGDRQLHRLSIPNHGGIRGYGDRAIRISIELGNHLLGRNPPGQGQFDLHLLGCKIVDRGNLHPALLGSGLDGGDHALGGCSIGDFTDDDALLVEHVDAGSHLHLATAIVIGIHIQQSALGKVGVEAHRLALDDCDLGLPEFHQVMGQELGRHADGDALAAQHQNYGQFGGKHDGFLATAVIAGNEFGKGRME